MAFSICIFAIAFFVGSVAQDSFGGNQGGFGGQQGGFGGPQGGFGGNQGGFGGNQGGLWGQQGGFGGQQSGFGGNQGGFGGPQGGFGGNQGFGGPQGGFGGNQGFGGPVGFGGNQRGGFSSYGGPGGGLAGLVLGDNNLTFPFPTFLQGLNRTDVRAFKRIAFNSSATPNEIESGLQTWANNQSSDVQTEFTQWTQNVTNFVTEIVSDADTIAANMSSNGQAVYEEVKTIILNANLTRKGKCAELISLAENSTVGAVLEVIQTFPILLNSCGSRGGRHGHHGPGGHGGLPQGGFGGFGGGFPSGFSGPQNGFGGFGNPAFVGVGAQTSVEVVYFDPDSN